LPSAEEMAKEIRIYYNRAGKCEECKENCCQFPAIEESKMKLICAERAGECCCSNFAICGAFPFPVGFLFA